MFKKYLTVVEGKFTTRYEKLTGTVPRLDGEDILKFLLSELHENINYRITIEEITVPYVVERFVENAIDEKTDLDGHFDMMPRSDSFD